MVADPDLDIRELVRWGGLLTLSFFAHLFLLDLISLKPIQYEEPLPQKIRISLSALAAPKIEPSLQRTSEVQSAPVLQADPTSAPEPIASLAYELTNNSTFEITPATEPNSKTKSTPVTATREEALPQPAPELPVPTPRLITKKPKLLTKKQIVAEAAEKIVPEAPKPEPKVIKEAAEHKKPKAAAEIVTETSPTPVPAIKSLANNSGQSNATVIHEANYRRRTAPSYPRRAYELGQQGIVTLAALVSPNGKTGRLKIEHSSGHRLLDRAAMAAVKKWEFEPLIQDGKKVSSWVRVPVKFVIN